MHELSIAFALVDVASAEIENLEAGHVIALRIKVGPLSGVAKDALLFSFEAATAGTSLEGTRLQVEETQAWAWCARCQKEQALTDVRRRQCPACESPTPHLTGGDELELIALEIATA